MMPEGFTKMSSTRGRNTDERADSQVEAIEPSVTSPLCAAKAARTSSFSRGGTSKLIERASQLGGDLSNSSGVM